MSNMPLMISEEALQKAQTDYAECSKRMVELRNKLKASVDDIRSGWQSEGGNAFFKKFDDEWYKNFNDYISVLDHMSENMTKSKTKYQTVFDEASKLKLHI